jgi:PKHD-type hydroxylase
LNFDPRSTWWAGISQRVDSQIEQDYLEGAAWRIDHTTERASEQLVDRYTTSLTLPNALVDRELAITNLALNPPAPEQEFTTTSNNTIASAQDYRASDDLLLPACGECGHRTVSRTNRSWSDRRWASHPGFLSPQECGQLETLLDQEPAQALVGAEGEGRVRSDLRRTDISWINHGAASDWLFARVWEAVGAANQQFFGYDIQFVEPLQYSIYRADDRGFYAPHYDWGPQARGIRKLSFTVQLSDPREYVGGDLVLYTGDREPSLAPREQGSITVFPSWLLHEVTPVTQGVRRALVGWIEGPVYF